MGADNTGPAGDRGLNSGESVKICNAQVSKSLTKQHASHRDSISSSTSSTDLTSLETQSFCCGRWGKSIYSSQKKLHSTLNGQKKYTALKKILFLPRKMRKKEQVHIDHKSHLTQKSGSKLR